MFRISKDNRIEISRGDTRVIPCKFKYPSRAPEDGTMAIVTLKRDYFRKDKKIWEKKYMIVNGRFNLTLSHKDTDLLDDISYTYDIQIRYPDGEQDTLLPPTEFKILGVVGSAE